MADSWTTFVQQARDYFKQYPNLTLTTLTATTVTATTVNAGTLVAGSTSLTGMETIDLGTGTLPAMVATANTVLRLANVDGVGNAIESITFGTGQAAVNFFGRNIGGTRASPSATTANAILYRMSAYGFDTALTVAQNGFYQTQADGLWSGSNKGVKHSWQGTPTGSTTAATWMTLDGANGLAIATLGLNNTPVGNVTAASAAHTTISATGVITSTLGTGTAPFTVASTTQVSNLNVSQLIGATWVSPGAIGSTSANTGAFTTLSASSTVSGAGFSTYLASPPAIGGSAAAAGSFTTLSASSTVSGAGFSTYLASPPAIGGSAAAAGSFTTLSASSTLGVTGVSTFTGTPTGTGITALFASPPAIGSTTKAAGSFTTLLSNNTVTFGSAGVVMTNVRHGITAALVLGTKVVTDTGNTANTRYFFSTHTIGTVSVPSAYYASARSAGASFTITSSQATDTSTVDWLAIEP